MWGIGLEVVEAHEVTTEAPAPARARGRRARWRRLLPPAPALLRWSWPSALGWLRTRRTSPSTALARPVGRPVSMGRGGRLGTARRTHARPARKPLVGHPRTLPRPQR